METDQLRLENYRGLKNHYTYQSAFIRRLLNPLLNDIPISIHIRWMGAIGCPHCTIISWIYLYILWLWVSVVRRWENSVRSSFHSSSNLTSGLCFNSALQSLPYLLINLRFALISCWVLKSAYSSGPYSVMICTMLRFFFFSFNLTSLFLIQCKMKIRTPCNTNIIMDNKLFFLNILSWQVKRSLRNRVFINSSELNL